MLNYIFIIILAYLIGSIPTSIWIGKLFFNTDVRTAGSGSSGATNTYRLLGAKVGIPVLIIDILKGFLATRVALLFFSASDPYIHKLQMLTAIVAVMGHIFPIFANFKGGKGIATLTGTVLGLFPMALLFVVPVFVIVTFISRYVSLGSILATMSLPFIFFFILNLRQPEHLIFSFIVISIVIITHRKNINRIFTGKENAFSFKHK